jgi:hypothetical protein
MLTLYGVYRSPRLAPALASGRNRHALCHVPVIQAYRLPDAAQRRDAPLNTASAEFLAVNPMGQIPAMHRRRSGADRVAGDHPAHRAAPWRPLRPRQDAETVADGATGRCWPPPPIETPALEITFAMAQRRRGHDRRGSAAISSPSPPKSCAARWPGCRRIWPRPTGWAATALPPPTSWSPNACAMPRAHPSLLAEFPGRQDLDRDLPGPPGVSRRCGPRGWPNPRKGGCLPPSVRAAPHPPRIFEHRGCKAMTAPCALRVPPYLADTRAEVV